MRLFAKFPRPWSIAQDEAVDAGRYIGGFVVSDANGKTVIDGGTYTGDGDAEFNLDRLMAAELVAMVNEYGASGPTVAPQDGASGAKPDNS
jgi:hypothetical protein